MRAGLRGGGSCWVGEWRRLACRTNAFCMHERQLGVGLGEGGGDVLAERDAQWLELGLSAPLSAV